MKQHFVTFTYQTQADDAEEAFRLALDAMTNRNGGWLEISSERADGLNDVVDGELAEIGSKL